MKLMRIYESSLGNRLKNILQKKEALDILEEYLMGGNYKYGGCFVLALALNDLLPNSEIWGLYSAEPDGAKSRERSEHFVVKIGDGFYDSDGKSDKNTLINRWSRITKHGNLIFKKVEPSEYYIRPNEKVTYVVLKRFLSQKIFVT